MSTQNATAPKPTSLKAAHVRIDELEKLLKGIEINESDILEAPALTPRKYMATGRVTCPTIGGLALPKGMSLSAFVDVEFEDIADANGVLHPPSREDVMERLMKLADKQYPKNKGVVLSDISVLPVSW